jgi:tyrosyl-tRNA synthetase
VHALCWPLLTGADGTKLGKTTGARVWLDPELTSPYAFYQHWINTDDAEVGLLLGQFTLLPLAEISALLAEHATAPERRLAQRALGRAVTELVHGAEAADAAEQASEVLFGGDPRRAPASALEAVGRDVPTTSLDDAEDLEAGVALGAVLVRLGLASSQGDARRQLEQGGVSVNGERATSDRRLGPADLLHGRWVLLRKGRKDWGLLDVSES